MFKTIVTAVLYAISFIWVIPALGIGVTIHGGFGPALAMALAFTLVSWIIGRALAVATIATLGLAGCLLFFTWWAVPALCLYVTAQLFPATLSIASAGSAIFAGLVLMVASIVGNMLAGPDRSSSSSR